MLALKEGRKRSMGISRRALLITPALAAGAGACPRRATAQAAQFTYEFANNLPVSHPLNVRAQEAADRIKAETGGKFEMRIFPNNQLGGDTDVLGQVRSGAVEFFTLSPLILST